MFAHSSWDWGGVLNNNPLPIQSTNGLVISLAATMAVDKEKQRRCQVPFEARLNVLQRSQIQSNNGLKGKRVCVGEVVTDDGCVIGCRFCDQKPTLVGFI